MILVSDVNLGSSSFVCGGNWVNDDIIHSTWTPFLGGTSNNENKEKMTDFYI